jgi:hypothetical protein
MTKFKVAATPPSRNPRTFRVASEQFTTAVAARATVGAMEEFHAQHNQKDHGNRGSAARSSPQAADAAGIDTEPARMFDAPELAKPFGGGEYTTDPFSNAKAYNGTPVPTGTGYLNERTSLNGKVTYKLDPSGMADEAFDPFKPDVMMVRSMSGRQRAFIKPTGKMVKANRTRPSLYEYDLFEVDTEAQTDPATGKSAIYGTPGKYVRKVYANSETVKLSTSYSSYDHEHTKPDSVTPDSPAKRAAIERASA